MLDLYHIPGRKIDRQIFTIPSTVTNLQWHTWIKPRGFSMMYVLCVGGGGGGGGGFTRAAAAAGGGGGGGAGASVSTFACALDLIPDRLFVQVGAGGGGVGSGGGTAGSGMLSQVAIAPDNSTVLNILVQSGGATLPGGGGTGTGAAVGAAGVVPTVATIAVMPLATIGVYNFIVGQVGTAGGAIAGGAGTAQTFATTGVLCMGATGGGGTTSADFAGGAITAVAGSLISDWRPQNAAAGTFDGSGGFNLGINAGIGPTGPFFSYPGLGGGSSNAGAGGQGGNGAYGSGGGGGGSGTTGGTGGRGGDGIVIITCW